MLIPPKIKYEDLPDGARKTLLVMIRSLIEENPETTVMGIEAAEEALLSCFNNGELKFQYIKDLDCFRVIKYDYSANQYVNISLY